MGERDRARDAGVGEGAADGGALRVIRRFGGGPLLLEFGGDVLEGAIRSVIEDVLLVLFRRLGELSVFEGSFVGRPVVIIMDAGEVEFDTLWGWGAGGGRG